MDLPGVPDSLQRLVRFSVNGFYEVEHIIVIDLLIINRCLKEEDIQKLLKFDKKKLRTILGQLKADRFLNVRVEIETLPNDKISRHNCYFINYRHIANIIKYKLHKIQKTIESEERHKSNQASYKCATCEKSYTELDIGSLFDPFQEGLVCSFCHGLVEEEESLSVIKDDKPSQALFNEQTEILYKLLKNCEMLKLSDEVLEPKPIIVNHEAKNTVDFSKKKKKNKSEPNWASRESKSHLDEKQNIMINMSDEQDLAINTTKEMPSWVTESTITNKNNMDFYSDASSSKISKSIRISDNDKDTVEATGEVMNTLLFNERSSPKFVPTQPSLATSQSSSQDFDDSSDEDLEEVDERMVFVGGVKYSYHVVASRGNELIRQMTDNEKRQYIEIGRQLYDDDDY